MVPIERHSIIRYSYDDESQLHNSATPCRLTDTRLYIDDRIGWVTDNNVTLKNDKTSIITSSIRMSTALSIFFYN